MNQRIEYVVKQSGLTKAAFAKKLSVSAPYVTMMCSGAAQPSDRTISDICREFGINENWLLTGEGDMKEPRTKEEEIADLVGQALNGSSEFKLAVIKMICSRTDKELETLEAALRNVYENL